MKNIIVKPDISVRQAMKSLNNTAEKCLLVADSKNRLLGTLTDGDLRRSILSGLKFSENISNKISFLVRFYFYRFIFSNINPAPLNGKQLSNNSI